SLLGRLLLRGRRSASVSAPVSQALHEWEYVPEGWRANQENPSIKGWNVRSVLDTYKQNWPTFLENLRGPGPLGISPESASRRRDILTLHNIMMAYGYVLSLAARQKRELSMLDWGGGIGHFYLLSRTLVPDLPIEYHCKDLPVFAEHGRVLFPDQ